jgi:hypothetical protein
MAYTSGSPAATRWLTAVTAFSSWTASVAATGAGVLTPGSGRLAIADAMAQPRSLAVSARDKATALSINPTADKVARPAGVKFIAITVAVSR